MATNQALLALAIVGLSERGVTRLRSFLQEIADDRCSVVNWLTLRLLLLTWIAMTLTGPCFGRKTRILRPSFCPGKDRK